MIGETEQAAYKAAIKLFEAHLARNPGDGTLYLQIANPEDGKSIGIDDPVIFADLSRSLEITNRMISRGEIRADEVVLGSTELQTPSTPLPSTTAELLKQAQQDHRIASQVVLDARSALKDAQQKDFAAGDLVKKLCLKLLTEQLGSEYEARVILYHMTGRMG